MNDVNSDATAEPQVGELGIHPLAELFPLLEGEDFASLVADVELHGVLEPIWLYQGRILDGRNRYRAAREAHQDFETRNYEGDAPEEFVVSQNLRRRHLSESQRAMVANKLATRERGRQRENGKFACLSQADAAKKLHVSARSVRSAKKVATDGSPALAAAVEQDNISVSSAARVATLPIDQQQAVVDAIAANPTRAFDIARDALMSNDDTGDQDDHGESIHAVDAPIDPLPITANILALTLDKRLAWAVRSNGRVRVGETNLAPDRGMPVGRRWINMCAFVEQRIADDAVTVICYREPQGRSSKAMFLLGGYVAHLQAIAEINSVLLRAVNWNQALVVPISPGSRADLAAATGVEAEQVLRRLPQDQLEALHLVEYARLPTRRRRLASPKVTRQDEPLHARIAGEPNAIEGGDDAP